MPTVNTERTSLLLGRPFVSRKRSTVCGPRRRIVMMKKAHAQQLDNKVAMPTPSTSYPLGNSRNMNRGSNMMLRTPPIAIPNPALPDSPTLRSRLAITLDKTVGSPPSTITHREYCRAKASVLPLAPRSWRIGFIKSSMPMEKKAVVPTAR